MLALSRKKGEGIVIGGLDGEPEIRVVVSQVRGDKVTLLIDAARSVPVHRSEVFEKVLAAEKLEN